MIINDITIEQVEVAEQPTTVEIADAPVGVLEVAEGELIVTDQPTSTSITVATETVSITDTAISEVVELGVTGPQGPQGAQGLPGPQGFYYVHNQGAASANWTIVHNLNAFPNVTVVDSANSTVEGDVEYVDPNTIRVHFSAPFSGTAYLS